MSSTCADCGTQYPGAKVNELHIRMNLQRSGETGCPHITEHLNSCCKSKSYTNQIIEVLSGNGHDENVIVDENIQRLRLDSEDFWMKTLRTNLPYGLNERSKDLIAQASIGSFFHLIERSGERNNKCYKNRDSRHCKVTLRNFSNFLEN